MPKKKDNESKKATKTEFDKMLSLLESPIRKELRREFNKTYDAALEDYKKDTFVSSTIWTKHKENLYKINKKHFARSLHAGYMRTMKTFIKAEWIEKKDTKAFLETLESHFVSYAHKQAVDSAVEMTKTSIQTVKEILIKAIPISEKEESKKVKNASIADIIKIALADAKERSIWRSVVSGLAVVQAGANEGGFSGASITEERKSIVFLKQWITMRDSKVRDTHQEMEGVSVSSKDNFQVPILKGGSEPMRIPGDRLASIGNWINCRCTIRYILQK